MLAAFDFASYSNATHPLREGDRLLLYTDGLIEAANATGDFFGRESLAAALKETAGHAPPEAADQILTSVQQWSASQEDDLTLIVCDFASGAEASA